MTYAHANESFNRASHSDSLREMQGVEGLIAKGWAVRLPDGGWALTELGRDAADDLKTGMKEQS